MKCYSAPIASRSHSNVAQPTSSPSLAPMPGPQCTQLGTTSAWGSVACGLSPMSSIAAMGPLPSGYCRQGKTKKTPPNLTQRGRRGVATRTTKLLTPLVYHIESRTSMAIIARAKSSVSTTCSASRILFLSICPISLYFYWDMYVCLLSKP